MTDSFIHDNFSTGWLVLAQNNHYRITLCKYYTSARTPLNSYLFNRGERVLTLWTFGVLMLLRMFLALVESASLTVTACIEEKITLKQCSYQKQTTSWSPHEKQSNMTESQNLRVVEAEKDLWRLSGPTSLLSRATQSCLPSTTSN